MAGILKKIIKGVLIGGGTALSLVVPPAGAGMVLAGAAVQVGSMVKTKKPFTVDTMVNSVNQGLTNAGLMEPAARIPPISNVGKQGVQTSIWPLLLIVAGLLFVGSKLFKKRR